jgi:carboxyl-terminal processing protease
MRSTVTRALVLLVWGLVLALPSSAQGLSEPEKNFEYLWTTFDRNYALFGPKHVDWTSLYKVYRPKVTASTTDDELFEVMSSMLGHLNDNHVRLLSPTRSFQSGILGQLKMEDFSRDLVITKYLKGKVERRMNDRFIYGWLDDKIGYFQFTGFGSPEASAAVVDEIVSTFKDASAVVVDVRANGGGDDRVGKAIADRFADRKRLYMKTRIRDGAKHDDFTQYKYWYLEPAGAVRFVKPVVLLTHRHSVSAAENFALAMRILPNVTVVGDATSGVFADVYGDRLPNGWRFSCSFKLFEDATGFCWEGIGVPADLRQINSKLDVERGQDRVLEFAMAFLTHGTPSPREDTASLRDVRESFAKAVARLADEGDGNELEDRARTLLSSRPDSYYVDEDEFLDLGDRLLGAERAPQAVGALAVASGLIPRSIALLEALGDAYAAAGDGARSRASYTKALELNRRSYPWEISAYENAKRTLAGTPILSRALARVVRARGAAEAIREFERGRSRGAGTYYVDEGVVNALGYELLGSGKVPDAIEIFKLNVREFPKSSNAYDSLGEAYMVGGQKELAITNYRKSLELDPQNENAVARLAALGAKP